MWAYFSSWDVVGDNDTTMKTLPCNIVVVTTRLLHSAEENKIVEYFHDFGPKRIPAGLPYAADGSIRALSARATKEMESMPYRNELVGIGCIQFLNNDVVHTRYMYVKRMRLTGIKQLDEIGRCAYHKVGDTDGNHTEQDIETKLDPSWYNCFRDTMVATQMDTTQSDTDDNHTEQDSETQSGRYPLVVSSRV